MHQNVWEQYLVERLVERLEIKPIHALDLIYQHYGMIMKQRCALQTPNQAATVLIQELSNDQQTQNSFNRNTQHSELLSSFPNI